MIRTYAAFVQNTIYPILDQVKEIIDKAEKIGLPVDRKSLENLLESVFLSQLIIEVIRAVVHITVACIICYTAYLVLA